MNHWTKRSDDKDLASRRNGGRMAHSQWMNDEGAADAKGRQATLTEKAGPAAALPARAALRNVPQPLKELEEGLREAAESQKHATYELDLALQDCGKRLHQLQPQVRGRIELCFVSNGTSPRLA